MQDFGNRVLSDEPMNVFTGSSHDLKTQVTNNPSKLFTAESQEQQVSQEQDQSSDPNQAPSNLIPVKKDLINEFNLASKLTGGQIPVGENKAFKILVGPLPIDDRNFNGFDQKCIDQKEAGDQSDADYQTPKDSDSHSS